MILKRELFGSGRLYRDGNLDSEIHRGENRQAFFQKIIDMLSLMGGAGNDFSSVRV